MRGCQMRSDSMIQLDLEEISLHKGDIQELGKAVDAKMAERLMVWCFRCIRNFWIKMQTGQI